MIQRIQSLLLLLAAVALLSLMVLPFATTEIAIQSSPILNDGVYNLKDNFALLGAFLLGGLLSLGAIFMYQNRQNQLKVARIAFIATLIGMILVVVFYFNDVSNQGSEEIKDGIGAYLPILAMILILVALRLIGKDEELVKSMDRLR